MAYKNMTKKADPEVILKRAEQLRDRLNAAGGRLPVLDLDRRGDTRRFKVLMPVVETDGSLGVTDLTYVTALVSGLPVDPDTHIIGIRGSGMNLAHYIADELSSALGMPVTHTSL